ncbi:MAG TPA: hypothetical protein VI893_07765 [Thermoplasmata archaeon]|nr:hypothetical protein [Thermoplasmata archaeon]
MIGFLRRTTRPTTELRPIALEAILACLAVFTICSLAPDWVVEEYTPTVFLASGQTAAVDWKFTSTFGFWSHRFAVADILTPIGITASVGERLMTIQPFENRLVKIAISASGPVPPEKWGTVEILVEDVGNEYGNFIIRIDALVARGQPVGPGGHHVERHSSPGLLVGYPSYPLVPILILTAFVAVVRHDAGRLALARFIVRV